MPVIELLLNILYSTIGTFLIGLVCFLILWRLKRILEVKADSYQPVSLENRGNCRNIYYLEVKSPEPSLRFTLHLNNSPLAAVYLPAESEEPAQNQPGENIAPQADQSGDKPASAMSSGVDTVSKSGKSVSVVAGKSAILLEKIGDLLPGSLGSRLKEWSTSSRRLQASSLRTVRKPQKVSRQVSGFQSRGGGRSESSSPQLKVGISDGSYFVQTPVVKPGEVLDLSLQVGSRRKRYPQGSLPYTLEALPVPVDFPGLTATTTLQNGIVSFKAVESWRYFLPTISTLALALIALTALVFLFRFIWL